MNDPHVKALIYRVKHDPSVNYEKAQPVDYETGAFSVRLDEGKARFKMKDHFATAKAAREVVEPFVRTWQFAASLEQGPGSFELIFINGEIEDRNPTPGLIEVSSSDMLMIGMDALVVVGKDGYPAPPEGIAVDIDTETMLWRYSQYRQGRDTFAGMAYFCLTVLEDKAGGRTAAPAKYHVSEKVLKTLGRLTGEKGGANARKSKGRAQDFTPAESGWVEAVVKKLIWRAAEVTYGPTETLPRITMATLPELK